MKLNGKYQLMKVNYRYVATVAMALFSFGCASLGSTTSEAKIIESSADYVMQDFIGQISDVRSMCDEHGITEVEFRQSVKMEFLKLASGDSKKFHDYVTIEMSAETQDAVIYKFLEGHAAEAPALDFISSFLAWELFFNTSDRGFAFEGRRIEPSAVNKRRIEIRNFCMNALESSRYWPQVPIVFRKTREWMAVDFWKQQSWHNAYPVSLNVSNERLAWWWVNAAISLLRDRAVKTEDGLELICTDLAMLYGYKLVSYSDRHFMYYRTRFLQDIGDSLSLLDSSLVRQIEKKYPGIDWRSPICHAIYWCEYGLTKARDSNPTLQRELWKWVFQCCIEGRVNIIEDQAVPIWVILSPNFEMMDVVCKKLADGSFMKSVYKDLIISEKDMKSSLKVSTNKLIKECHKFGRNTEGEKLYAMLNEAFPEEIGSQESYSVYARRLQRKQLKFVNSDDLPNTICIYLENGYALIAADNARDGEGLLDFATFVFDEARAAGVYKGQDIDTVKDKVLLYVIAEFPDEYALRLKKWKEQNRRTNNL